jgi:hypothetical protein
MVEERGSWVFRVDGGIRDWIEFRFISFDICIIKKCSYALLSFWLRLCRCLQAHVILGCFRCFQVFRNYILGIIYKCVYRKF